MTNFSSIYSRKTLGFTVFLLLTTSFFSAHVLAKEVADNTISTPPTPTNLTLGTVSASSITLSWTPTLSGTTNKNAGFKVYRLDGAGGNFANARVVAALYSGTASTFTDTGVTAGTTYTYKVAGFGTDNSESSNSNAVSLTTPTSGTSGGTTVSGDPQNPSSLFSTLVSGNSIRLSWTPVGTADYFWIYRSTSAAPSYSDILDIISGSATTYLNSNLQPGTTYYYRVRAARGYTEASLTTAPITSLSTSGATGSTGTSGGGSSGGTASSFQVTSVSTSSITLAWPLDTTVSQVKIYRSTQSGDSFFTPLTTLTGFTTSYVDGGLTPSLTYYYRLTTVKNGIESPLNLSPLASGTTPAYVYTPPTSITSFIASPQAGSSVILNWSYAGTTVDNFHVFRNSYGSYGAFESVTLVPGSARAYADTNLQAGATYYYRITSIVNGVETSLTTAPQTLATATADPTAPNNSYWWNYNYNYSYNTYPSTYTGTTYTTYPSYVSNPVATTISDTKAKLTWTSSGPADSFNIYQSPDNFSFFVVDSVKGATVQYTAQYLLPASHYWFKITSVRGGLESSLSSATTLSVTTSNTSGSAVAGATYGSTNAGTATSGNLLTPSYAQSPIKFNLSATQGTMSQGSPLTFRYQFTNTGTVKKSFVFKEEIITQYGSVLATTNITEGIKSKATLTIPARRSTANLPVGLYVLKISVNEQTGKTLKYLGENDFHFRIQ